MGMYFPQITEPIRPYGLSNGRPVLIRSPNPQIIRSRAVGMSLRCCRADCRRDEKEHGAVTGADFALDDTMTT
jgi:hypothetical protein